MRLAVGEVLVIASLVSGAGAQQGSPEPAAKLEPHPSAQLKLEEPAELDREAIDALIAKLRPLVEKHAKLAFVQPPNVLCANGSSWQALVRSEMPRARDLSLAVATTWALYVPERGEIVLSPYLSGALIESAKAEPVRRVAFAQPALAHELVHVLQEQHFKATSRLRSSRSRDHKNMLKFLIEGHATWVEENVATTELGHKGYAAWSKQRHLKARRMQYTRGRDYIANVHTDGGHEAVVEALRGPLPTWLEFVRVAMRRNRDPAPGRQEKEG